MPNDPSMGGCQPLPPPRPGAVYPTTPIANVVRELIKLSPEDFRGVAVPIIGTLTSSIATATSTYRVPATHNFAIRSIIGTLSITDYTGEILSVESDATHGFGSSATSMAVRDRMMFKAMNCKINLSNSDRSQNIIDNTFMYLSSILLAAGGSPINFEEPLIVPAGETVSMTAALVQSTVTNLIGGSTDYGVILVGSLVRVAAS